MTFLLCFVYRIRLYHSDNLRGTMTHKLFGMIDKELYHSDNLRGTMTFTAKTDVTGALYHSDNLRGTMTREKAVRKASIYMLIEKLTFA